ncbi:J domain-containing protein [Pseudanabaena sp. PCC 6802]|uniref:J domain-containing protein n=1 Tax=Pseudanabaena sp. PCC 6802 TaxID=118173 RepID=UPI000375266E|nr:J domain-containing protein [Pseudanabaena sp. PCC 6802]
MSSRISFWMPIYKDTARVRGYKRGWVWHQLQKQFSDFTLNELQYIGQELGYKPSWAEIQFVQQSEVQQKQQRQHPPLDWRQKHRQQQRKSNQTFKQQFADHWRAPTPQRPLPHWGRSEYLRPYLDLLGLDMPFTEQQLKAAYRSRAKSAHPDGGGSHASFLRLKDAYDKLRGEL